MQILPVENGDVLDVEVLSAKAKRIRDRRTLVAILMQQPSMTRHERLTAEIVMNHLNGELLELERCGVQPEPLPATAAPPLQLLPSKRPTCPARPAQAPAKTARPESNGRPAARPATPAARATAPAQATPQAPATPRRPHWMKSNF